MEIDDRIVTLECTTNTRDLGGLVTEAGRQVRRGLVFRTDAVIAPTDADRDALHRLGLRHSFDFRAPSEVESFGPNDFGAGVVVRSMPLLDDGTAALGEVIIKVLREGDATAAEELLGGGRSREWGEVGPTRLIGRPAAREAFAEILRLLADGGAPVVFNCTAGKDRTGVFAAVLLRLLGVAEETIAADYVLSNQCRAASNAATYERLGSAGLDVDLVRPLMEQTPAAILGMFRAIDEEYGDFDAFVEQGLGLDDAIVEKLRDILLS